MVHVSTGLRQGLTLVLSNFHTASQWVCSLRSDFVRHKYVFQQKILCKSKKRSNFANADRQPEAPVRGRGERKVVKYIRKRLSALILDWSKCLANFHIKVKDWATVDARGYVIVMQPVDSSVRNVIGRNDYIHKRGLLALPSDFDRAMREASTSRRQQIQIPTLFPY